MSGAPGGRPLLRFVPPAAGHLATGADAPALAWLRDVAGLAEAVGHRAGLPGVAVSRGDGVVRVVGPVASLAAIGDALAARGFAAGPALARALAPAAEWRLRTRSLPLARGVVMGILNLTGDSFSGDGVGADLPGALRRADELRRAGAAIVDAGAESARADRPVADETEEAKLAGRVVAALVREGHLVSADTYKPAVARAALEAGAEVVNDISGLTLGTGAAAEAAAAGAAYVLNYSYSVPKHRPPSPPAYADVVDETAAWMDARLAALEAAGMALERVAIDPGIAFGKSHDEDLQVMRRLGELQVCGLPVLLAHSRKNFIGSVTGRPPAERDLETHVVTALAFASGARIFRVHDPAGARRALDMAAALTTAAPGHFAPGGESWPWRAGASAAYMTGAPAAADPPPGQRW